MPAAKNLAPKKTMKKTYSLINAKIARPRMIDAIKFEAKKYLKRSRNKALPEGSDFWDFDCRFGRAEDDCQPIHVSAINKTIDAADASGVDGFYLEILPRAATRSKKPKADAESDAQPAADDEA